MKASVYVSPKENTQHSLKVARRVFTKLALKGESVALVREAGLVFEVTFSRGVTLVKKEFGNFNQVTDFLLDAFPGNLTLALK
jgi:hypothetical protein